MIDRKETSAAQGMVPGRLGGTALHAERSPPFAKPEFRRHAERRSQQRAVPTLATALLLDYGTCMRHRGADVFFFDKAARRRIRDALGGRRNLAVVEPWLNTYAVIDEEGRAITVAHRQRRLKRP